jgi:hypothetical protein
MFCLEVSVLRLANNSEQQQQQQQHSHKQPTNQKTHQSLFTQVNKEVEQQFSGRGVTLLQEKPASLNVNNLRNAAELHFALFCHWGHAKLSLLII